MTIPTRPAPAPPSAAHAAAGANASLERLRLQLEQQQQQEQQQRLAGVQKLTIKLPPPPPKAPINNGIFQLVKQQQHDDGATSSITRKFPAARYAPATNWNDTPFDNFTSNNLNNGYGKKPPPPRPPPPKINARKSTAPAPPISPRPPTSVNILSNLFNRKKQAKTAQSSRIYGVSSGVSNGSQLNNVNSNYSAWNATTTTTSTTTNQYSFASSSFETCKSTSTTTAAAAAAEAQLISFDSPPSSPTFTQKSNSDCVSVDSFSSDSNFSSPNNGSASQPESGFEDDFSSVLRGRQSTTSPLDPWETLETLGSTAGTNNDKLYIGTAPVRNLNGQNTRLSTDNPLCNGKSLLPPAPSLQMPTIIKPKISQKSKAPKPPALQPNKYASHAFNTTSTTNYNNGFSLIDVISGKADALLLGDNNVTYGGAAVYNSQPYGISLYDFDGVEEGDLSFRENEKIYLLEQVSAEWYLGRTRSGCEGIFPVNYIDIKVPLPAPTVSNKTDNTTPATVENQWPTACSLYNFPAEVDGDLALKENDLVTIYYKINDDWLYGEVNGRLGQFPANFLDSKPTNLPPMPQY